MNSMTFGPNTSVTEARRPAKIAGVSFEGDLMSVRLDDDRTILLNLSRYPWLQWLLGAAPEQRQHWEIMPSGGGVWWPDLDEGIELQPLLAVQALG